VGRGLIRSTLHRYCSGANLGQTFGRMNLSKRMESGRLKSLNTAHSGMLIGPRVLHTYVLLDIDQKQLILYRRDRLNLNMFHLSRNSSRLKIHMDQTRSRLSPCGQTHLFCHSIVRLMYILYERQGLTRDRLIDPDFNGKWLTKEETDAPKKVYKAGSTGRIS